jgi:hypothetical protein
MTTIDYRQGNDLVLADVVDVYRDSTLAERRPIDDVAIVAAPKAVDYYPKLGFRQHASAWVLGKTEAMVGQATLPRSASKL